MAAEITELSHNEECVDGEIFCLQVLFPEHRLDADQGRDPLMAFKATSDPDTMYHHEAMKEPDAAEFTKAMVKEVEDQMANGNFSIVRTKDVPKGKVILPAVWQMK